VLHKIPPMSYKLFLAITLFLFGQSAIAQKQFIDDNTVIANYILMGSSEEYTVSPDNKELKHGTYNKKCSDESTVDGEFLNGKKHGTWISRSSYGDVVKAMEYKEGKPHGRFSMFNFEGTKIFQGHFYEGKKDSIWINYADNGEIIRIGRYDKGKPVGDWVRYSAEKDKPELVYAFDSTQYVVEPKREYVAETDPILQNALNGFYFVRFSENQNLPKNIEPFGGWDFAIDQFLNNIELPGEAWNTFFKGMFKVYFNVNKEGEVNAYKVEILQPEKFQSGKPYLPYFIQTSESKFMIKNPDHIDNTYESLSHNILEAFYMAGPWIIDADYDGFAPLSIQVPVKMNYDQN